MPVYGFSGVSADVDAVRRDLDESVTDLETRPTENFQVFVGFAWGGTSTTANGSGWRRAAASFGPAKATLGTIVSGFAMSIEEESKAVVRSYVDAFNRGDLAGLKALLDADAEIQGVMGKGTFDRIQHVWRQLIEGYGMQLAIQGLVAEGNVVAARYVETGTFRAPAFGHPPTGRSYELVAMEWFEIEHGRIKRRWGARDSASQLRQLGVAPSS